MKKPKKNLLDVADHVLALLIQDERTRDDDQLLCCMLWSRLLTQKGIDVRKFSAYEFLLLYYKDELPMADTITRARRKVQEENMLVRGKKYNERHAKQAQVMSQLRAME
jgi:hypothetical protein